MSYEQKFKNLSVLGAAGKMGSGILSLVAVEAARLALENNYTDFSVNAVDSSPEGLLNIKRHIKSLLVKYAEKNIVSLRKIFSDRKDLVENEEIINEYADFVYERIYFSNRAESCAGSDIIFEAIIEDKKIKCDIINTIENLNKKKPWYLTNTSSIPINELDKEANLDGRIIGFHFYNPPPVQKLVELIHPSDTNSELVDFSHKLAEKLGKQIVLSNDVAGFIGNGFFMRDILTAVNEVKKLQSQKPENEALVTINSLTKNYLLRPMGIFQLIDYVGIDVCSFIMKVMNPYFEDEELKCEFLERYLQEGIRGGQKSDASQRDGIFQYQDSEIIGYYDFTEKKYQPLDEIESKTKEFLGESYEEEISWDLLKFDRGLGNTLQNYFGDLFKTNSNAAKLSYDYLSKCKTIGEFLVENETAKVAEDVNMVMQLGFYHHYGPVNDYVKSEVER